MNKHNKDYNNGTMVAFDLDDTLYKERYYVESGYRYVRSHVARAIGIDEELLLSTISREYPDMHEFDAIEQLTHGRFKVADLLTMYREHFPDIVLPSESQQLLEWLSAHNYKLALITDGRHSGQWNKIKALQLTRYFPEENIIVSADTGGDKTTFIPWQRAEALSADCHQRVYIGDNPLKDFYFPNLHGWDTIMLKNDGRNIKSQDVSVPDESYRARHAVKALSEVPDLLTK